jgi:hypothetical protein
MNLNPDPAATARLEALAYQAQDYALHKLLFQSAPLV